MWTGPSRRQRSGEPRTDDDQGEYRNPGRQRDPAVSGTSASGTTTLREPDQSSNPSGQQYDITITVTDGDGATTTQTQRVTVYQSGSDP